MRIDLANKIVNEAANPLRWREVFESKPTNDFETAYKFFYLNRTSFSGKLVSPAWGYREKRSLPPIRWKERIIPCGEYLKGVELKNEDFAPIISSLGKNALIYVDPPYYTPPKNKHYRNGFSQADHERLADCLKKTNSKFFLTYDDCRAIRELYSWANINEVKFFYRVDNSSVLEGKRKLGFELIITNYNHKAKY